MPGPASGQALDLRNALLSTKYPTPQWHRNLDGRPLLTAVWHWQITGNVNFGVVPRAIGIGITIYKPQRHLAVDSDSRVLMAFFASSQSATASTGSANPGPEILDWPGLLQLWKNKSPDQALPTYVPTYVPAPHAGVDVEHAHPESRRRRRLQYALFTALTLLLCILVLRWLSGVAGAGVDSNSNLLQKNATAEAPHVAAAPALAPMPSKNDAAFIQNLETSTILELAGISSVIGNVLFVLSGRNRS
uniref:Uncharacterized protein n=1 Tax=Mycena chlorophos TaxID=658473 RepID=A0ABQ0LDJ5_MYCCL|nr:predicted protein [Mycena chlorophos]